MLRWGEKLLCRTRVHDLRRPLRKTRFQTNAKYVGYRSMKVSIRALRARMTRPTRVTARSSMSVSAAVISAACLVVQAWIATESRTPKRVAQSHRQISLTRTGRMVSW